MIYNPALECLSRLVDIDRDVDYIPYQNNFVDSKHVPTVVREKERVSNVGKSRARHSFVSAKAMVEEAS